MNDREKLIELLRNGYVTRTVCSSDGHPVSKYVTKMVYDDTVDILADYLIDNGVTVQRWIPVTERLPIDEKPVLVCYRFMHNGNDVTGLRYTGTLSYFCFDPEPHWQHDSTGLIVTHWMPRPEPPKEDAE